MVKKFLFTHGDKFLPVIGLILFIYIIQGIGTEKIIDTFLAIPATYYAIALLLFIPKLLIATYKWKLVNNAHKIQTSFGYLAYLFLVSVFYGSVTPGGIGYHLRIYFLAKKTKIRIEKSIANTIVDGIITFMTGIFLAFLGSIIIITSYPSIFVFFLILLIFYIAVFIFFMEKHRGSKFMNFLIKLFIPKKYKMNFEDSIDYFYEDLPRIRDTIIPFGLEMMVWIIAAIQVYVLALAFSIQIPLHEFILLSILTVIIATVIPLSVGGIGIREGAFVLFLSTYGVSNDVAFVLSLAGYLVKNLIPSSIGMILAFAAKLPIKTVKE